LSGMAAGVFLLFVLLAIGPVASQIPASVLAGILITVGIGVMDYKGLKAIPVMPRTEVVIMLVVMVLSAVWNLVFAVGIGLIMAALLFMKKIGDMTSEQSSVKPLKEQPWPDEMGIPEELKERVFIKHIEGPLFFGSSSSFQQLAAQIPDSASTLIIRLGKMPYMDQSGLYAIEDVLVDLVKNGKKVLLIGLLRQPRYMLESIDIIPDLIPEDHILKDFDSCVGWVKEHLLAEQ